ncbi:SpoVT-AbrB domain-containing protein [Sphingomonas antarctica]|uniref:AbrB/MazE/SpoVT family DNA-binding domain-containing protein n=1 Tax=Sphingomonas antarctica TaxID=2040274 RepID=UPI0039EC56C5
MLSALRKIGNSTGIVLPKPVLAQIGLASGATLDLTVEDGRLIGTPVVRPVRAGWAEAAAALADERGPATHDWLGFANEGDDKLSW